MLPRVQRAYEYGYWLPRLVLPSLLVFLGLGLALLGRMTARLPWALRVAPAATAILTAIYIAAV